MNKQFKDFLHFNKTESKGILSLIVLIILVIIIKENLIHFSPIAQHNKKKVEQLMAEYKAQELQNASKQKKTKSIKYAKENKEVVDKEFNPNNLSLQDWQHFGLSEKQAQVILNYKDAAGGFKSKAQVKKMFVISDELYAELEPFIALPEKVEKSNNNYKKNSSWSNYPRDSSTYSNNKWKPRVYEKVYINTADTAQFKSLYGIGKVLSERIVKRREDLGGFYSKSQLQEIYGLKSETLERLDTLLVFNEVPLKRMSINQSTVEELKSHPYIYWKQANSIVKYKEQHGAYKKIDEIKKSVLITDSIFDRIKPYLKL